MDYSVLTGKIEGKNETYQRGKEISKYKKERKKWKGGINEILSY